MAWLRLLLVMPQSLPVPNPLRGPCSRRGGWQGSGLVGTLGEVAAAESGPVCCCVLRRLPPSPHPLPPMQRKRIVLSPDHGGHCWLLPQVPVALTAAKPTTRFTCWHLQLCMGDPLSRWAVLGHAHPSSARSGSRQRAPGLASDSEAPRAPQSVDIACPWLPVIPSNLPMPPTGLPRQRSPQWGGSHLTACPRVCVSSKVKR